jgi:hypothetical protein
MTNSFSKSPPVENESQERPNPNKTTLIQISGDKATFEDVSSGKSERALE